MTQPTLLDLGARDLFQASSPTSHEAAVAIRPAAETLRAKVLEYLRSRGETGATDEEIQDGLGMAQNTERPRRVELVEAGSVVDSGETRKTRSGRKAVIWRAK